MPDSLRDRIAAVIEKSHPGKYGNSMSLLAADAVIRELGLHEEELDGYVISNGLGQTIRRRKSRWRYVTEWETNE